MKRGGPLKRSGPIKAKPKPRRTALELDLMARFGRAKSRRCASCGSAAGGVKLHAHHVLRRQRIEDVLARRGYGEWEVFAVAWDPRWSLTVCTTCHGDHHSGMKRLPLSLVVRHSKALLVAEVHDLRPELESEYTKE